MNVGSVLLWGFVATMVLTTFAQAGQSLGFTRISLPFVVGTMFTGDRDRATLVGFTVHLLIGWAFACVYALAFESWRRTGWLLGAGAGLVHGLVVLVALAPILPGFHPRMASEEQGPTVTRQLEPPGPLALHYGPNTPLFVVVGHAAYGIILGVLYKLPG
jgi:uncharacterized membrane protein YagU involved in acid resistance